MGERGGGGLILILLKKEKNKKCLQKCEFFYIDFQYSLVYTSCISVIPQRIHVFSCI